MPNSKNIFSTPKMCSQPQKYVLNSNNTFSTPKMCSQLKNMFSTPTIRSNYYARLRRVPLAKESACTTSRGQTVEGIASRSSLEACVGTDVSSRSGISTRSLCTALIGFRFNTLDRAGVELLRRFRVRPPLPFSSPGN